MLQSEQVKWVEQLLAQGHSQRQVSRITGIARNTVARIASGHRPDFEAIRQMKKEERRTRRGKPQRCPGCGHRVYLPCLICRNRRLELLRQITGTEIHEDLHPPIGLGLKGVHRRRYEEIRAARGLRRRRCKAAS